MDNIMKNVQGNYIKYFEQKLKFVIGLVLQKCSSNQEDQKRLFKLFKSWEVLGLFNHRILEDIAAQHNLRALVSIAFDGGHMAMANLVGIARLERVPDSRPLAHGLLKLI